MNVKAIFGSRLIEEQMCGNMIGILLRISVSNAYLSSCLRKRFRREVLANIHKSRKNHKLDEWHTFCDWIKTLPYSELITGKENN